MVAAAKDWPDFTRATLLVGVDEDGNPLGVLVDDAGNLTAVLKGVGAEGLQTIGVDSQGRIEVFILDNESQWGDVLRIGNAEMAARLGSARAWDWRGQTLHYNDFGRGMGNVIRYPQGAGADFSIDPVYWVSGGYSLMMTAGSDGERYARVDFAVEHPPSLQMGLEACWSCTGPGELFKIEMRRGVGGWVWIAAIRHNYDLNRVQYRDSAGDWQSIANPYYFDGGEKFHRIKVVADFDAKKYVRILYADTEFDASAIGLYQSGIGYSSTIYCEIKLTGRVDENDVAYLDSYVVTVSEPL